MFHEDTETRDLVRRAVDSATPRPAPGFEKRAMSAIRRPRPEPAGRIGGQASAGRPHPLRRAVLLPVAVAVLVGAVALSPVAQATTSSIAGSLLREAGILPADQGRVALPGAAVRATSSGYTVALAGAYGDQFRTVLFFHIVPTADPVSITVSDESGAVLSRGVGVVIGGTDGTSLEFSALPPGRHRLTAHLTSVLPQGPSRRPIGDPIVRGDWTLRFPLEVGTRSTVAATPASGELGRVHVVVVGITGGGPDGWLDLELHTTGATFEELLKLRELQPGVVSSRSPGGLEIQVLDAAGQQLTVGGASDGPVAGSDQASTWRQYLRGHGPGAYRLVVTFEGHRFESRFTIR
jgi:hypothetical protein